MDRGSVVNIKDTCILQSLVLIKCSRWFCFYFLFFPTKCYCHSCSKPCCSYSKTCYLYSKTYYSKTNIVFIIHLIEFLQKYHVSQNANYIEYTKTRFHIWISRVQTRISRKPNLHQKIIEYELHVSEYESQNCRIQTTNLFHTNRMIFEWEWQHYQ